MEINIVKFIKLEQLIQTKKLIWKIKKFITNLIIIYHNKFKLLKSYIVYVNKINNQE
jgi:hypothetical protein